MRPLRVRRAGVFERSMFAATALIGTVGVLVQMPISGSLEAALGEGATWYFAATMVAPGGIGFWAVRKSQRERTPHQIEVECRMEWWTLAGIAVGWAGFASAAIAVGWRAVAVTILILAVGVVAPLWRMWEIRRDLRKLHAAMEDPKPADPPPIAEGDA